MSTQDDIMFEWAIGLKHSIKYYKAKIETLEAENERLRSASFVTAIPSEQYERVIKAGDSLALLQCGEFDEQHKKRCVLEWLAAKEGKPLTKHEDDIRRGLRTK